MLISFECQMKTDRGTKRWKGMILRLLNHGSHFEIRIESRSGITVIFGKTSQGGFACMPDQEDKEGPNNN